MKNYDVILIGAGPGGIFSAYELCGKRPDLKIAVFERGGELKSRKCPIDGKKITGCIHCPTCAIMNGFGGAGAFSDGKYNITNAFGGTLYEYIGKDEALELMRYVDEINAAHGGDKTKLYTTANSTLKTLCLQNNLHLLDASVRHLGTDINYEVLTNLYDELKEKVDFYFHTPIAKLKKSEGGFIAVTEKGEEYAAPFCIVSVGRSGSKWMETVCADLGIQTHSNRVDLGVRVELPADVFKHITDEVYESKIVYKTTKYQDLVRGRRSTVKRIEEGLVRPTLAATPGDLSLVLPKRILDGIIEMIYALDKIAPGTANDDTLLYGVEVKFYNMEVALNDRLMSEGHEGLYVIGDGSGITHSLSHASASGVFVAREIAKVL